MNWKPERISTKLVIPLVVGVIISLCLVFFLLTRHTMQTVISLNTAALRLETKRLYNFCEKAVEELVVDQQFGDPALIEAKKEVVLSEIENDLLAEGVDGFTVHKEEIILSTIEVTSKPKFESAMGTLEIESTEGSFHGYYHYFPIWEWYLVTLIHEKHYWASHDRSRVFLTVTGVVYILLGLFVLLILLYGLQKPLSIMVNQLNTHGRISLRSGTREFDLLSATINSQLESIIKEAEAKAERKKIEHELEIARDIQQSLLPTSAPDIKGLDIAAMALPAMQVGGDFYDFIPFNENRLGIVIADVSGKGMPAALIMALSRALIRVNAMQELSIIEVVGKTNILIQEFASSGYFVTLFYGIVDSAEGTLHYVRAGHNPPLLYRNSTDEIMYLKGGGMALGVVAEIQLEAKQLDVLPGDVLLLFTDGVTEAINSRNEEFGIDRLKELLRGSHHLEAERIIGDIKDSIVGFAGLKPQFDDITLMVLKI